MFNQTLKVSFLKFCEKKKFEKNNNQLKIIHLLSDFISSKIFLFKFFFKSKEKLCFYLFGNVGVGKTMILDFFYESLNIPKKRIHFNEFMLSFHDYRYKNKKDNKDNSILRFVLDLKKNNKLIYLDEFQVTNIVDAMILGKLFETIFQENIKILISTNTKIDDLYKDGLQRDQFLPFISIIKENSIHKELLIDNDYRKQGLDKLQRAFYPLNEKNLFNLNQLFREITKDKIDKSIKLNIKGRDFIISNYFEGVARFDFKELCDLNVGSEDYLQIAKNCKFIIIENIPKFNNEIADQQNRFIILIDILYEKKIPLAISASANLKDLGSSNSLKEPFKRTLSRLYELTSPQISI